MTTVERFFRCAGPTTLLCALLVFQPTEAQEVGQPAPDFSLRYATRDSVPSVPIRLSSLVGSRTILLAFYPADWSGGCTKEVCSFRDDIAAFDELDVDVLAISGDYVYSHHAWAKELGLPFRLLSDHDHAVARAYKSYNESSGYNRRTVFVVDRQGRIVFADLEYSVRDDADFKALQTALRDLRP